MTEWIGYAGVFAFLLAWIPQSLETIRLGRCSINAGFLALAAVGSFCLTLYAFLRSDVIFSLLNALTTTGALVNAYYRLRPRSENRPAGS